MKLSAKSKELIALDAKFSKYIIERDGKCVYPNCGRTSTLTCSHYHPRARWGTRWLPDNCDTLCMLHHTLWEHGKCGGSYKDFKIQQLGYGVVCDLREIANSGMKRAEAVEAAKMWMLK